ncbi:hypothetical protein GLOIN_2v1775064 [Rhizophagus irregularis DAOM 181602=DAOM 197198]|nr:hypothetical protein GLOIN_2v1775064 [Rhizophagus irregularis DAOM 181602=DAOM 197198]
MKVSLEDFDMTVLPMGSVIGSELENFNVSKYPLLTQPVELVQRNKEYKKMDCKWYINLSKPESNNFVCITFIQSEHNHELLADNIRFAAKFQRFDQSVMKEIECAVIYERYDAYTIRNLLQPLFPNQIFFTQDISNAIQKIKREKQISGSDASVLLKFLLKQQKEEPMMFVQPLINVDIDNDGKSCLGVQAFLNDETQESYEKISKNT